MDRLIALLRLLAFLIIIILFVGIAIANRDPVLFNLDPFGSETAALGLRMPLFLVLFGFFLLGFMAGAIALWAGGGKQRKDARAHRATAKQTERAERKAVMAQAKAKPLSAVDDGPDSKGLIAPSAG